jgi:DNA-binding transcriptional LysR family regulator
MTRPDLRELECFVAVADHLNFSRAAKQLHLSQPPLTRHIQALEQKLGSRLFERNTHSVALTDPGRLFLEDARSVLSHLDRAGETIRRARQGEPTRLRVAFIGALLDERFVRLIRLFREKQPNCQIQVTDLAPASQLEALRAGALDGGFIGAQPTRAVKNIGYTVWGREPLLLAVPEKHPLTKVRVLRWLDLKNLSWVMVSRSAAPAFRQQFSGLSERHGLAPRIVQESERVPAILTMVAAGSGVTMVPQGIAHLIPKGIHFRKLPSPQPFLQHTFAYRIPAVSPQLHDFLALLKKSNAQSRPVA